MNTKSVLREIIKNEVSNLLKEWSTTESLDRRFASYSEAKNTQDVEKMILTARRIAAWIYEADSDVFIQRLHDIQEFLKRNNQELALARKYFQMRLDNLSSTTSDKPL